jgi:hypothetical protein
MGWRSRRRPPRSGTAAPADEEQMPDTDKRILTSHVGNPPRPAELIAPHDQHPTPRKSIQSGTRRHARGLRHGPTLPPPQSIDRPSNRLAHRGSCRDRRRLGAPAADGVHGAALSSSMTIRSSFAMSAGSELAVFPTFIWSRILQPAR